jgi:uncharacterized protein YjeT (DUF2065 family)
MAFIQYLLVVLGLMFMGSVIAVISPRKAREFKLKYTTPKTVVFAGLLMLAVSTPILVYYLKILYPLDLVVILSVSTAIFIGLVEVLFPHELTAFVKKLLEKSDNYLRTLGAITTMLGLILLRFGLE